MTVSGTSLIRRLAVVWLLLLCGMGAWVSGELVKQHANLWPDGQEAGLFASVCEAVESVGFTCAGRVHGRWTEVRLPVPVPSFDLSVSVRTLAVPVAFLGLAYFVFFAVWFAFIGGPRAYGNGTHRIPLTVGLGGILVSLFYLAVMALGLAPWCVWCVSVHLINFLLVLSMWRLNRCKPVHQTPATEHLPMAEAEEIARRTLTVRETRWAAVFSLVLVAGLWMYRGDRLEMQRRLNKLTPYKALVTSLQENREFLFHVYRAQRRHRIAPRADEVASNDRAQLVVFTDFECPGCYCNVLEIENQILKAFDGRLEVMVRHYPLCDACNDAVNSEVHANACEAAYAAEAARLLGGREAFRKMHRLLFRNRRNLGGELYRQLAIKIGLDPHRFLEEMEGDTVRETVAADIELAKALNVQSTPAMFLNGRRVSALLAGPVFWQSVADAWDAPGGEEAMVASVRGAVSD